jgi:hypothetical protein
VTWILAAFLMLNGELHARMVETESKKECIQMRDAISVQYPAATVICVPVEGQGS